MTTLQIRLNQLEVELHRIRLRLYRALDAKRWRPASEPRGAAGHYLVQTLDKAKDKYEYKVTYLFPEDELPAGTLILPLRLPATEADQRLDTEPESSR